MSEVLPGTNGGRSLSKADSSYISTGDVFADRHIGPDKEQIQDMLDKLGQGSLDDLAAAVIPKSLISSRRFDLPKPVSESRMTELLSEIASLNKEFISLIGMGYYASYLPEVIKRNVLENPAWYSAYTPYQPEISQGRLEALLNYQTMVSDLTGHDIANASLLDEATAAAEALSMLTNYTKDDNKNIWFIDANTHPQTINVVRTRAIAKNIDVVIGDPKSEFEAVAVQTSALLLSYPGSDGALSDCRPIIDIAHRYKTLVAVATDLLACVICEPPGALGADVTIGSAMRFGLPFFFGGPHPGFIACKEGLHRYMPGRLVGVSKDRLGNTAYRLALQTREQHIKRERATSNICTAQSLPAIIASMYAVYHGPKGLKRIAQTVNRKAILLAQLLNENGYRLKNRYFFDTVTVETGEETDALISAAAVEKINLRKISDHEISISLDETTDTSVIEQVISVFAGKKVNLSDERSFFDQQSDSSLLPAGLIRQSSFLVHKVFNSYQSETEMMRYLRRLSDKDLALDRTMIPLGSCTMKLNAAAELAPIGWPGFNNIHPFAPDDQSEGWQIIVSDLENYLAELSGYKAVSLQPNAGSQGEFAGLLAIKAYYRELNQTERTICLIPKSAHGTNAASAAMAGYQVIAVACDDRGNVDFDDLKDNFTRYADHVAVLMLTYPSTHGVFEENILQMTSMAHDHGSQVYIDGANMNALTGIIRFSDLGGDVSHFNLHKTFAIPHGGGGPGVGPIGVREHLVSYLPAKVTDHSPQEGRFGDVISAAPYGSAGILPITWAYIRMMGADGLTKASKVAILNANYLKEQLSDAYEILYTGPSNYVAHEVIVDLRRITQDTGVTVDDIAKRLMDFGIHAPTVSFPVANTMMIEPTESESKSELDKFVNAMLIIRREVSDIEEGKILVAQSPLANAPHSAKSLLEEPWDKPYSRLDAAFPLGEHENKYWPPCARIDAAYGDRNLFCTCPAL